MMKNEAPRPGGVVTGERRIRIESVTAAILRRGKYSAVYFAAVAISFFLISCAEIPRPNGPLAIPVVKSFMEKIEKGEFDGARKLCFGPILEKMGDSQLATFSGQFSGYHGLWKYYIVDDTSFIVDIEATAAYVEKGKSGAPVYLGFGLMKTGSGWRIHRLEQINESYLKRSKNTR